MTKRSQSIIDKLSPVIALIVTVTIWAMVCGFEAVPSYMLPSPLSVVTAFIDDFPTLMRHAATTLTEVFVGLPIGIILSFIIASLMDRFKPFYNALYPLLIISQTIPTVAIAPILIMWMGFDMAPKIALIVITTFFPITIGLLDGFASVDSDTIMLLKSMGAKNLRIFFTVKLPSSLNYFFAGLKISVSYAVVGGVIAEWLGGFEGLGVYMTAVRKGYRFDRMFAVIILIIIISLLLMLAVSLIKKLLMPWESKKLKH